MKKIKKKNGVNWMIILYSLIGLVFVALGFFVNYLFFLGAVVCVILNQREINKGKK